MGWRRNELSAYGSDVVWLSDAEATAVSNRAQQLTSTSRYGLNEALFASIDRLNVDELTAPAKAWLSERTGDGNERLLIVYDENDVCEVRASFFIENGQDLFCPSRDDLVILPVEGQWALFYCHEDEFEFARYGCPD